MEVPPPSLQPLQPSNGGVSTEEPTTATPPPSIPPQMKTQTGHTSAVNLSNPTGHIPPPSSKPIHNNGKLVNHKNKKKQKAPLHVSAPASSSASSSSSPQRGTRVANRRRNPRILVGLNRRGWSDVEAIALPLGFSIAAVVAQVLEMKDAAGERMSADHLSMVFFLSSFKNKYLL
ncbi:hypothetical protein L1049_002428 [Liquidambar formosana]|uniref:Uncharacterized protein n=1 Tax=Liquidambar formosana TaxID=63359 RepID=A0AAP0NJV3_LIQFO